MRPDDNSASGVSTSELVPAMSAQIASISGEVPCEACQRRESGTTDQFIYALGQLDVRMPTIGMEREFQQRERTLPAGTLARRERIAEVLRINPHLARSVCYLLMVGGLPAYVVVPSGREVLEALLSAFATPPEKTVWTLIIGRRGPMAGPTSCGGVLAPFVTCDQVYSFSLADLSDSLARTLKPLIKAKQVTNEQLSALGAELFERIASSIDNSGALDSHRALNYLLVQHPGLMLAYAQRGESAVLDSVETRVGDTPGMRRVVTVILTFLDRLTGVPERLFTRVDTTEEWPFLADSSHGGAPGLGLRPFVEHGLQDSQIG